MATDPEERAERRTGEPNLELPPLFGLGRRKRRRPAGGASHAPEPAERRGADPAGSGPGVESPESENPRSESPGSASPGSASPGSASPAADPEVGDPVSADPVASPPTAAPDEPARQPLPDDASRDLFPALGRARRRPPVPPPVPSPVPSPTVADVAVTTGSQPPGSTTTDPSYAPPDAHAAPSARRSTPRLPSAPPVVAAPVTGAVVGLLGVLLAYLAAQGCEILRGVGSCGSIGALALSAIVLVEVLAGAVLLRALRVPEHTGTSLLGVGLAAVVALVFLLGSLMSAAAVVVLPLLTAGCFLAAWWLTTAFTAPAVDDRLHR